MATLTLPEALRLARDLETQGRTADAEQLYRQVLAAHPDHPDALFRLALIAYGDGRLDDAEQSLRRIVELHPGAAAAHNVLGCVLHATGRSAEAIDSLRRAVSADPSNADGQNNLGMVLWAAGQPDAAEPPLRAAIQLRPTNPPAWNNLGNALLAQGRVAEAADCYLTATQQAPNYADAFCNLGQSLGRLRRHADAIAAYRMAVGLNPSSASYAAALAAALHAAGQRAEAEAACRQSLVLHPDNAAAHNLLGQILQSVGRIDESNDHFRKAIALAPSSAETHDNLLMGLHYDPGLSPADLFAEHQEWARRHAPHLAGPLAGRVPSPVGRRLRVGYVSPDFRHHAVAFFFAPLLANHDRSCFEVFCYSDTDRPDATTDRFRAQADHWRDTSRHSDAGFAALVREDGIDLLIDLVGHAGRNRLRAFATRPAPVQFTYLGYPNTTGLATVDFRITDALADPPGQADGLHAERLLRLPRGAWCYHPPADTPSAAPPRDPQRPITFGTCNVFPKINPQVIETWARLLGRVPDSQLLLKNAAVGESAVRDRMAQTFAAYGITADRIRFLSWAPSHRGHLATYNQIDIALDTFPYNGTTTTCEALWMGTPVVTVAGTTHVSRVGVSLLTAAGLPDLIATTLDQYVDIAAALAADRPRLASRRAGLRDQIARSPLRDETGFCREFESALLQPYACRLTSSTSP